MIRLICPVCARAQEVAEGKEFIFCKYCGLHMNVAEVAAATAAKLEAAQAAEAVTAPAEAAAETVTEAVQEATETVAESVEAAAETVTEAAQEVTETVDEPTEAAAETVMEAAQEVTETVAEAAEIPAPQEWQPTPVQDAPAYQPEAVSENITEATAAQATAEAQPKKKKKSAKGLIIGLVLALLLIGGGVAAYLLVLKPSNDYKKAEELMAAGEYAEAIEAYEALGDYKDAPAKIDACLLQKALGELKSAKYSRSVKTLKSISDTSLDISEFDRAANTAVADLIKKNDLNGAKEALEELEGHAQVPTDAILAAFEEQIAKGDAAALNEAEKLRTAFPDVINDAYMTEVLGAKIKGQIEAGEYYEAADLLTRYQGLNLDMSEAIAAAFAAQLEGSNYDNAYRVLLSFSETIDRSRCTEAVRARMQALLKDQKDDEVLSLWYLLDDDLDLTDMLTEEVKASVAEAVLAEDYDRIDTLLTAYAGETGNIEEPVDEKLDEMIFAKEFDKALAMIRNLKDSYSKKQMALYITAQHMAAAGELERALAVYREVGENYEDVGDRILGIRLELVKARLRTMQDEPLTVDEYEALYTELTELDGYDNSREVEYLLIRSWYADAFDNEDGADYAERMIQTVTLTEEQKESLKADVLEYTPDLAAVKEDGALHYYRILSLQNSLTILEHYFTDSDDPEILAFMDYEYYLIDHGKAALPSIDEVKLLWMSRPDLQVFCSDGDPLLLFLTGNWTDADGNTVLSMGRNESGGFSLDYDLPLDIESGYLDAMNFGLSVVDEDNTEVSRICDITIVGLNTIEVLNATDGITYTLTRTEE